MNQTKIDEVIRQSYVRNGLHFAGEIVSAFGSARIGGQSDAV